MLKSKLSGLKNDIKRIRSEKGKEVFLVFISEEEDKVLVDLYQETIFSGSYAEYTIWYKKNKEKGYFVQMHWDMRDLCD